MHNFLHSTCLMWIPSEIYAWEKERSEIKTNGQDPGITDWMNELIENGKYNDSFLLGVNIAYLTQTLKIIIIWCADNVTEEKKNGTKRIRKANCCVCNL